MVLGNLNLLNKNYAKKCNLFEQKAKQINFCLAFFVLPVLIWKKNKFNLCKLFIYTSTKNPLLIKYSNFTIFIFF